MKIQQIVNRVSVTAFISGVLGGLLVIGVYAAFLSPSHRLQTISEKQQAFPARFINFSGEVAKDFVQASAIATPAVVHIKSLSGNTSKSDRYYNDEEMFFPFRDFFGDAFREPIPSAASGSGVIISNDGYVVTNNHVIENASTIEVILNDNRKYEAKIIGTDPSTDLALLKINETGLPFLKFGDSDKLLVGEWVLAVGNPFNLTSTVTAGIVSAKARNINILSDNFKVESFIQTDAAVNPGNSGGALINTAGELVGINTAIATRTGTYNGYSFAVPSNLVRKVVDDLLKYGVVQRGFLGIMIRDVDAKLAEEKSLGITWGVYVDKVNEKSAAQEAGIKPGDVIIKIDGVTVKTSSELQEQVSRHRPGDQVKVTLLREGTERTLIATLKNKSGSTSISLDDGSNLIPSIGVALERISEDDKKELRIKHGVRVTEVSAGKFRAAGIRKGFIITHIDKTPVYEPKDVVKLLENKEGATLIEGIAPNGRKEAYAIMF
ncbi:MAG: Do family serine endopeptidase [Bacteroidia bacterium]|nr:Do family serine endopeptidase [Bacteroidia bacterium]MDW8158831.1 Do family serine endopeptidase [Bacteroidia bacterium]